MTDAIVCLVVTGMALMIFGVIMIVRNIKRGDTKKRVISFVFPLSILFGIFLIIIAHILFIVSYAMSFWE